MKKNSLTIINEILGEDFVENLSKAEIYKPNTKTTVSHEEIADALQIVPRAVLSWLTQNLSSMKKGDVQTFELPFAKTQNSKILVNKLDSDVYNGEITKENKIIYRFKYRSIPGIGLVLLTSFELYDIDNLENSLEKEKESKLSSIIDERIALRSLISQVVEEKLSQRDAIEQLIKLKFTNEINKEDSISVEKEEKKANNLEESKEEFNGQKLKNFLNKKKELKKTEDFKLFVSNNENINCPDCGQALFDGKEMTGCLCYGSDMGRKIFLNKNENGSFSVRFGKDWDPENVSMLLEVLKRKNYGRK